MIPVKVQLAPLLAALLVGSARAQHEEAELGWPFGVVGASGPLEAMDRQDLYNLGLIGAKARDADAPEPQRARGGVRRRIVSAPQRGLDQGPRRLLVQAIFPGGPAQRAGLQLGDVISAVNGESFDHGCFDPLAKALVAAEAGEGRGRLRLQVARRDPKSSRSAAARQLELEIKIPPGGEAARDPIAGKARAKILRRALDWLAKRQGGDGGFAATLGGQNGALVQTCLASLAWIAGGSRLGAGRHGAHLRKAYEFVLRGLRSADPMAGMLAGQGNWDQTTWGYAHAALFLGELYAAHHSRKVRAELQKIAAVLCERQEASGGYGHGPGGRNALGYIELNILGGLVFSGLGLAHQAGCQVDPAVVDKLAAYLVASSGADGGVGYSTLPGQKGVGNIGRTAAAWLGMVGLGRAQEEMSRKMEAYTRAHIGKVLEGHASLMQHILLAGIAARALGGDSPAEFWRALRRDFILARAPDGSFQPRPWHESLLMQSNTDVAMGEVWTTASWAIVLAAGGYSKGKGGLRGLCGRARPR